MSEHPVLIPTSQGPAGGMVCEPVGPSRAALLFFHTGGHAGRSGFNSEWTALSRQLAPLGVVVLRIDFSTEADSSLIGEQIHPSSGPTDEKVATDAQLVREAGAWFHARTGGTNLISAGACYGSRAAIIFANSNAAVSTTLLVTPYFRRGNAEDRGKWKERMLRVRRDQPTDDLDKTEPGGLELVDPDALDDLEGALRRGPAWVLAGERDATGDALALQREFGDRGLQLHIEPGVALYPGNDPDIQELVADRLVDRVSRCLRLAERV